MYLGVVEKNYLFRFLIFGIFSLLGGLKVEKRQFSAKKWLFLADFDPVLPYIKVKGFWEISGSVLNNPPYVYDHNFWTDAPNLKIQGILKTRDQWLSFYNKMKEIWINSLLKFGLTPIRRRKEEEERVRLEEEIKERERLGNRNRLE